MAIGNERASWPAFGAERVHWEPSADAYVPRSRRAELSGPYTAAVPPPIAQARLHLPPEVDALVAEATAQVARFDAQNDGPSSSFAALLLRTEAASSSQIEHLTSSAKAIALSELGRAGRANADQIVANVATMISATRDVEIIDVPAVLAMHELLMRHTMPQDAGRLRTQQVWIGGSGRSPHGADYVAPTAARVPAAMDDLVRFAARTDVPLLAQVALTHAQFETIHPFTDGNGRTGRALMHTQLRVGGLTSRTIVPVSAGLLADTGGYFAALDVYRDGEPAAIVERVCEAVFPAIANAHQLARDVAEVRSGWATRIRARRDAAAWRLVDLVATRPVVDNAFVATQLDVTGANAQIAIDRLVEAGVLVQIGSGRRHRIWQAPDVLAAMEAFADRAARRT